MKAYALLTGHTLDLARLPDLLRSMLARALRHKPSGRVANSVFGPEARAWALSELRRSPSPLEDAGKLGYVLFQLAPWVKYSDEELASPSTVRSELPGMTIAIEFRNRSWFGAGTDDTLRFLNEHDLTYVSIDGPRSRLTVPSLPALTGSIAVFRLHGRNFEGYLKQVQGKAPTVAEKYDYLYSTEELEEIARAAGALNGKAARVHLAMNNNRSDYPAVNGVQLKQMLLEDWRPPDRDTLIEELKERRGRGGNARSASSAP